MGGAAHPSGLRATVVGRDAEVAILDAFVAAVPSGARALLVCGESGIGKTTLVRHGMERCRAAGHTVLHTRPSAEELRLALVGLTDLFEDVPHATPLLDPELDPLGCGRAVLAVLRSLSTAGPVVVVIDDLQWLDSASARALRFALRRLDAEPIGVLAATRPSLDLPDPLTLDESLPPGRRDVLELQPLSLEDVRRLLGETITAISRPALRRIHKVSGGNPLYALELARGLSTHTRRGGNMDAALPSTLHSAIDRRLETAPKELEPLLAAVAAHGVVGVQEVKDALPDTDAGGLLALAEDEGLLVVDEDLRVSFAHPMVGSAMYSRLSPLVRRELHAGLAGRATDPDVRARHLALSTAEPDGGVAQALEEAAARSGSRGAFDLAAEFAEHSVRLTPAADEASSARRSLAEVEYLGVAGEARRALEIADRLVATLPAGHARARALVIRARLQDDHRATAEAFLLQALEEAGDDELLRCRVLDQLGTLRAWFLGDVGGAVACAREALEIAERAGDPELSVLAMTGFGHLSALAGAPRPDLMTAAVALERNAGGSRLVLGPRLLLAKQHVWAGDLEAARSELAELVADGTRVGNEFRRPQLAYDLALVECAAGRLAVAEDTVREGIEAARDAESSYYVRLLRYPLALVLTWRGRSEEARETAERVLSGARQRGRAPGEVLARRVLGLLALSSGETDEAAAQLSEAARLLVAMGIVHPGAIPVLPDAIEACARAGEVDAARAMLERYERQVGAVDTAWGRASLERSRGILLLAVGDAEAAATSLETSRSELERLGHRPEAARAALAHGQALLRAGRRAKAADALARARELFAQSGAVLWELRAADELDRAAPGRAEGELTAAEQRIAALVADGRKNREVGGELFMSVATVEAHLTRIYRKLGIGSRSELTRIVAERGLTLPESADP